MFEVGFTEIILILGLALLVLGPEKLPALAQKIGRWTGRARAMARQLRAQLEHEVTLDELAKSRPAQPAAREQAQETAEHAPASNNQTASATEPGSAQEAERSQQDAEAPAADTPMAKPQQ